MTTKDLKLGQTYEVVERIPTAYSVTRWPKLSEIIEPFDNNIRTGTLMKYVSYDRTDTLMPYGFHFIIDGKIIINNRNTSGIFWFSEVELS